MKYFKKLTGKQVYLSPMNTDDTEMYVKWMNDSNITDGLGCSSRITSFESERTWLTQNSNQYQFAIVRLKDDLLLGNCGLQFVNQIMQTAEVGLFIGEEQNRSKGYGGEVLDLLLDYAFDSLNLHSIMLRVFSFNERAIHCYKKVGFKEIGRRRESYYLKGKYYDEVFMDILKEERQALK